MPWRYYGLVVFGVIVGVLVTIMISIMNEPIQNPANNFHCERIVSSDPFPSSWPVTNFRTDSGVWWNDEAEPIGFSYEEDSDICIWRKN